MIGNLMAKSHDKNKEREGGKSGTDKQKREKHEKGDSRRAADQKRKEQREKDKNKK